MESLKAWIGGWRAALLSALIALAAGLPGLASLPTLDRNEAHFVQATSQMMETGDYVSPRFQDRIRAGGAPGAHWLQVAAVRTLADPESRTIWLYRLWSLAGAVLAATACAWGAESLFGRPNGLIAGAALGASFVLATSAGIATADALAAGAQALMIAAFGRIYACAQAGERVRRRDRVWMWAGLILAALIKGRLVLGLAVLTLIFLLIVDRRRGWIGRLGWGWGLLALLALAGPWVVAVTVSTDGQVWIPLPPVEAAGEWPGWQTLISPLFLFPATALFPLAIAYAIREWRSDGVKVALAWLLPGWLLFEFMPGRHVFATLPLYIAIAWLGAAGFTAAWRSRAADLAASSLSVAAGLLFAVGAIWVAGRFGEARDLVLGLMAGLLFVAAGGAAAIAVQRRPALTPLVSALVLSVLGSAWLAGVMLPRLDALWTTRQVLTVLDRKGLDPREGLAVGPVASAGYDEPSLVFALGARTETGDGALAARAIAEGRPAVVEAAEEARFQASLKSLGARAEAISTLRAYDYALRRPLTLTVYRRGR